MRSMSRRSALKKKILLDLTALLTGAMLGGCIVIPGGDGGYHHEPRYYRY
jgi:hypothetical protein